MLALADLIHNLGTPCVPGLQFNANLIYNLRTSIYCEITVTIC